MDKIQLTRGRYALVDKEDFEWLNKWKWLYDGKCAARIFRISGSYRKNNLKRRHLSMHVAILEKYSLTNNGFETDHINRNPLDNRKSNLRVVTHRENAINRGLHENNKSGFKGVIFDRLTTNIKKKWKAQINLRGKHTNLGRFLTKEEAAIAYNIAAKKYFGEFNYYNQI